MSSNTNEATTTAREQDANDASDQATATIDAAANESATATQDQQPHDTSTSDQGRAIPNAAEVTGATDPHADDTTAMQSEPKPDVSDQGAEELLPRLLAYFHNNREELARAIGVHRSSVDRWILGKMRPNNSTVLRMRRIAQERRIE
jgi:hypothetical protein